MAFFTEAGNGFAGKAEIEDDSLGVGMSEGEIGFEVGDVNPRVGDAIANEEDAFCFEDGGGPKQGSEEEKEGDYFDHYKKRVRF